jgi:hypothetical protein
MTATTTTTKAIHRIECKRVDDDCPDLSWLDQTDEQMGAGFESRSAERKASYGDTWTMVGTYAVAEIVVGHTAQTIRTAGLWGTESDSDDAHFAEIEREEVSELVDMLAALGFTPQQINGALEPAGFAEQAL